jgi:ParB family chromosome partitioning protein
MAAERRGLGKGIAALIPNVTETTQKSDNSPENPASTPAGRDIVDLASESAVYSELEITRIMPNPKQPRTVFDEDAMAELVHSLKEIGLLQPIVVRPITKTENGHEFEIVAGERRWRASQLAGFTKIPAIIRQTNDDVLLRDSLLENLHRAQLNALEEAAAYQQLLDDFGCTQEELSTRIGRSRPQISNTIRLLRLPPAVQRRVAAGVLSPGHARALLALGSESEIEALATRIVAEGLSVRATEEIVALGGAASKKSRTSTKSKTVQPGLKEISDRLADHLETRVKIDMKNSKGTISIEFATVADLQRIVDIIERDA